MDQTRINRGALSVVERQAIDWLLPRIPAWVTPDHLTAFGTLGAFLTLVGYSACNLTPQALWLANLGLVIHWYGDSLDGNLARHRSIERPRYGYFLDQTVDVIGNFLICFGMGLSPYVDMRVALFALAGYHTVSIYVFVRAAISRDFHVALAYFGPTELRAALIFTNVCILVLGAPAYTIGSISMTWVDLSVSCFAIAFFINFAYQVSRYAPYLRDLDDREREEKLSTNAPSDTPAAL